MKKLGFIIIGVSLLAAACNSKTTVNTPSSSSSPSTNVSNPPASNSSEPELNNIFDSTSKEITDVVSDNLRVSRAKSIQATFKKDINNNQIAKATGQDVADWQYPTTLGSSPSVSDPVTGKPFEYKVDSNGKDYTLCIALSVKGKVCGKSDMNWSVYTVK